MAESQYVSAWPSTYMFDGPDSNKKITQCLWGDWVSVRDDEAPANGRIPVRTRGKIGWLKDGEISDGRVLEVNFVDVGQGDGAFIVTPDDGRILIDAGASDNMYRFLKWRFNLRPDRPAPDFELAVISHPDEDHYEGFRRLFEDSRFRFDEIRHNGIVERTGDDPLGPSETVGRKKFLTGIMTDHDELNDLLSDSVVRGKKQYPNLLWTALQSGRVNSIRSASAGDVLLERNILGKQLRLRVLAPVREQVNGRDALRSFGGPGPTKNGHSVVVLLEYGDVKILLGGDLNIPAEEYLMQHYGAGTTEFQADVAKACHHGSADFTTEFLDLINPIATIVSSGDSEPHSHPRADSLGTIGKHSRGDRSLIFSTELARSTPERIVNASAEQDNILELVDDLVLAENETSKLKIRNKLVASLGTVLQRSVEMFGMISLRTDGDRILIAQRLERARGETKWDTYPLTRDDDGELRFHSKH